MKLPSLEYNKMAVVDELGEQKNLKRLHLAGIRPGATIEVLSRASSGGFLIKVDDTRLVLSLELAQKIDCTYR